jgi:DNA invertase Pin-like site-specific DNA recombinase
LRLGCDHGYGLGLGKHKRLSGASLKATEQPIDTGTAAGKCFLDMLGVFAKFETNLRREQSVACSV